MAEVRKARRPRKTRDVPASEMTIDELRTEVVRLRQRVSCLENETSSSRVSAVDRSGRSYTRAQMVEIFERLYHENPKAILLMFPNMSREACRLRAQNYGISIRVPQYTADEDAIVRKFFPDMAKTKAALVGRTAISIKQRRYDLGLFQTKDRVYEPDEDALLLKCKPVPGRSLASMTRRRRRLGINGSMLRAVLGLSSQDLIARVEDAVPKSYPPQVRQDAVQSVMEQCLTGKCWPRPAELAVASKKAITAVYKLHPDRGAPISMDAKLYEDGDATVGDRISADAFHF